MLGVNNYSFLFNNNNSNGSKNGNLAATFNFADLATIKNGSYKRLLKAQYADDKKTDTKEAVNKATATRPGLAAQASSRIRKSVDALQTSVKSLNDDELWKQEGGSYDTEKITGAIKDFAAKYNSVVSEVEQSGLSTVKQSARWMNSLTDTMSNSLKKIGVSLGEDNRLTVDEETLKNADMKSVKAMFDGAYSYASQISDKAGSIASASLRNMASYTRTGTYAGLTDSWFNTSI